jgi:MFS family permease
MIMGGASDRIGRKMSAVICALVQVAAMIWVTQARELWTFYLFAAVYGFTNGGMITLIWALISDTFGVGSLGAITGALVVGFGIGAAIGPMIGGVLFDVNNDYFFAFLAGAAAMLMAALLMVFVRRESETDGRA